MRKRDEQLRALLLLAQTLREGDSVKEISSRLTQLNVIIKSMENHPLIKETGLCKFSYDLSNVSKYMGTFSPLQNNVIIVNSIIAQQTTGINTELSITETINGNIDKNVQNYKLPDEITRTGVSPTVLKFNDIRISKDQQFYIIYIANANANEIIPYDSWNNIKAEVKVIIFDISTISSSINSLNALYAPIYQLTGITKLSLGLSLFILIAVLILIIELSSYILRLISLLRSRKPLTYSLRRAFGFSSLTWKTDIIIGVILLILSYVVDSYVTIPLSLPALSIEQLSEAITKDPLIAIAVAGYAGSFIFLFFAFIDRFKRLLSGKEYDEAVEIPTAERNIKNWQVLKEKIEETKKLLEQAAEMEMDVGQQMSQLLSIPLDSLRNDIYSNPNQKEVKDRIIGHINNVEAIKASVMQKMELAKQKRAEWLTYIDQKLEKTDMLPLDALVTIPNEWRFWAAKEYIKEHPEKFSSIEGVMLVKKKLTEEEKAQKFLLRLLQGKEEKVKCLLIVKEKKILSAIIKEKRESLIKNLGLLINEEMSLFNAQSFFAEGDKLSMGIKTLSDKKLIVLAEKDVIDEILSNAEKLEKMLE
jgi:hypothetical protein